MHKAYPVENYENHSFTQGGVVVLSTHHKNVVASIPTGAKVMQVR